jgi:hypothetical protein
MYGAFAQFGCAKWVKSMEKVIDIILIKAYYEYNFKMLKFDFKVQAKRKKIKESPRKVKRLNTPKMPAA